MAIVSVRPLFEGRGGTQDWKNRRVSPRNFEVVVNDIADQETEVVNAVDPNDSALRIPEYGDSHPSDAKSIAVDFDIQQSDETWEIWYVRVNYDSQPETPASQEMDADGQSQSGGENPANREAEPLARGVQWRLDSIDRTEVVREWLRIKPDGGYDFKVPANWVASKYYTVGTYVANGANVYYCDVAGESAGAGGPVGVGDEILDNDAIWEFVGTLLQVTNDPRFAIMVACLNSGSCPFDPPEMVDVSIPTVVLTRNMPNISLAYHMQIKNAVNLTRWKGIPPRCAKVLKFSAGNKTEGKLDFIEGTWEIGLDPDTWDARILDSGYGALQFKTIPNPAPPPPTTIKKRFAAFKDPEGEVLSSEVPMDGAGGMLPADADPVYLRGVPRQQKLVDFNELIPW